MNITYHQSIPFTPMSSFGKIANSMDGAFFTKFFENSSYGLCNSKHDIISSERSVSKIQYTFALVSKWAISLDFNLALNTISSANNRNLTLKWTENAIKYKFSPKTLQAPYHLLHQWTKSFDLMAISLQKMIIRLLRKIKLTEKAIISNEAN